MAQTKKPLVFRDRDTKEKIPFYVKAEDVELPDGTDIETKVGEIEEALEGAADGTVKSVTLNGTKGEPDAEGDVELTMSVPEVDDELDAESGNAIANSAVAAAIAQLRSAIESVLGEGSTSAIENFQEVLDFLENVNDEDTLVGLLNSLQTAISGKVDKTDIANALDVTASGKVLDARQGKALNDLIAALQSGKSDKSATVSGLSYDTTSHKLKQTVNGTASDVMTVDTAPTANSDNPVTSGGVSTALATLLANISIGNDGYWYIGQTSTGVKAQGPKGNSVVDGDTFDIVNNLTDGGEGDALSAEMGKTLKAMIDRISAFTGYAVAASVSELPSTGDATTGYIVGTHIYAYVETGGDTAGGKYQDLGDVAGAGTYVTTNGDGTFTIHVGSDTYSINLNHTHENMAKLVVCEESDLPSTLDNSTIYAITDSGETEIEKLIIRGMEFAGGGGSADDGLPKMATPKDESTIDLGSIEEGETATKDITVRAKNLNYGGSTTGLTVEAVGTGLSLTYGQTTDASVTIPQADAMIGALLRITYSGSSSLNGELSFKQGSSVLASVVVVVVVDYYSGIVNNKRAQVSIASGGGYVETMVDDSSKCVTPIYDLGEGNHVIKIRFGYTGQLVGLNGYDSSDNFIEQWVANANERTVTLYNNVTKVRATLQQADLDNCYIYDVTAAKWLFKGNNVTQIPT